MRSEYFGSADLAKIHCEQNHYDPITEVKEIKTVEKAGHSYDYYGKTFSAKKSNLWRLGKVLALIGEVFLIIITLKQIYRLDSFQKLVSHTWKEARRCKEIIKIYVEQLKA